MCATMWAKLTASHFAKHLDGCLPSGKQIPGATATAGGSRSGRLHTVLHRQPLLSRNLCWQLCMQHEKCPVARRRASRCLE